MGKRRHREEEHENHERWLVSYADFITLLFAFFVVMYAISSVNDGKYRVLSSALNSAFSDIRGEASAVIGMNNPPGIQGPANPLSKIGALSDRERAQKREKLSKMARDIKDALAGLAKEGQINVTEGAFGLTIDINSSLLFASGDSRLNPVAVKALAAIGQVLASSEFPIAVEGHTDNAPINSGVFQSNWELSAVRAASVVRVFVDNGVSAGRLTATGYADQRPVADNATPDGRQRNRRVAVTIAAPLDDNSTTRVPATP